jgi:LysR family transcriptional regulator, transcriptional activator of nhaA
MAPLPHLNYQHLRYFHATVRAGTVTAAARQLRLAQPTLSAQIRQLEEALDAPLFERRGRRLELTAVGRLVADYAERIFGLGDELVAAVRAGGPAGGRRLSVGVVDGLPKLVVAGLLEPALAPAAQTHLEVRDGELGELLGLLGGHRLDLVLADAPLPPGSSVRALSHPLGACGVVFFAPPALAAALAPGFPHSLDRAPLWMPARGGALRRELDTWFDALGVAPRVLGEIADSALLKALGQRGAGAFAAPAVVEEQVVTQYQVAPFGRTEAVQERFYALSAQRGLHHPGVEAVLRAGRARFG